MTSTEDFFIPDNEVKLPEELDYTRAVEYIRSAEAFSRSTYQSVVKWRAESGGKVKWRAESVECVEQKEMD